MWKIMGKYQGKAEQIDEADTEEEAVYLRKEYREAFGAAWTIWIKKDD